MRLEALQQFAIEPLAGYNNHILVILGSGADKRDAADVDFLDDVLVGCALGHIFFKRVEVHHHQVDGGDVVLLHLGAVAGLLPAGQDAAEYFGVEGLHAAAQNGGITCKVFHLLDGKALLCQIVIRASGGEQFGAARGECSGYFINSVFVKDRYQSPFYFFDLVHFQ